MLEAKESEAKLVVRKVEPPRSGITHTLIFSPQFVSPPKAMSRSFLLLRPLPQSVPSVKPCLSFHLLFLFPSPPLTFRLTAGLRRLFFPLLTLVRPCWGFLALSYNRCLYFDTVSVPTSAVTPLSAHISVPTILRVTFSPSIHPDKTKH